MGTNDDHRIDSQCPRFLSTLPIDHLFNSNLRLCTLVAYLSIGIRALNQEKEVRSSKHPKAQVEHLLPHQYITREWIGCPDTMQSGARR